MTKNGETTIEDLAWSSLVAQNPKLLDDIDYEPQSEEESYEASLHAVEPANWPDENTNSVSLESEIERLLKGVCEHGDEVMRATIVSLRERAESDEKNYLERLKLFDDMENAEKRANAWKKRCFQAYEQAVNIEVENVANAALPEDEQSISEGETPLSEKGTGTMAEKRRQFMVGEESKCFTFKSLQDLVNQVARITTDGTEKPKTDVPLFKDYGSKWLESRQELKQRTRKEYTRQMNYLVKLFGSLRLDEITRERLQGWIDMRVKEKPNIARATIKKYIDMIGPILQMAIEDGYVTKNPARSEALSLPKKVTKRKGLSKEQLNRVKASLDVLEPREQMLMQILINTGVRKSEARGLKWQDITWSAGGNGAHIHVCRTYTNLGNKMIEDTPKSESGDREIPIGKEFEAYLLARKKEIGYLVCDKDSVPMTESAYARAWAKIKSKIELYGATAHTFRHTFATMLLSSGKYTPKEVEYIMGHADIKMTMDTYAEIEREGMIKKGNALEDYLKAN